MYDKSSTIILYNVVIVLIFIRIHLCGHDHAHKGAKTCDNGVL